MTIRQWHLTRGQHLDGATGTLTIARPVTTPAEPSVEVPASGFSTRRLGVIGLALVLIAAMDSIRNLPTTGTLGLALVVGAGVVGALFTFFLGFIPASHLSVSGTIAYVAVMAFGMIVIVGTPFLLHRGRALNVDARVDPNLPALD